MEHVDAEFDARIPRKIRAEFEGWVSRGVRSAAVENGRLILTMTDGKTIDVGQVMGTQGPAGPQGPQGVPGQDGAPGGTGPQGPQGIPGPKGDPGAGLEFSGEVDIYEDLPTDLTPEDAGAAYIVREDHKLYVWSGTAFPAKGQGSQFVGPQGPEGPQGPQGIQGVPGQNGTNGTDGTDGEDGFSPTVAFTQITNGYRITITDATGAHTADILNGTPGADGQDGADGTNGEDGADGVSPVVSVAQIAGGHSITITDATGPHTVNVMNGIDGANGTNGVSPAVTITPIEGGSTLTIVDATGSHSVDIMDGTNGADGAKGDTGATGPAGTSAYQAAVSGGYTGTEAAFNSAMSEFPYHNARHLPGGADPILVKTGNVEDAAITAAKIADSAVTTAKIAANAVTRAKLANDALYSPVVVLTSDHTITVDDIGKTLNSGWASTAVTRTVSITAASSSVIPVGAEIAICRLYERANCNITISGARVIHDGKQIANATDTITLNIPAMGGMIALKKFEQSSSSGDVWLVTGNVEVVT